MRLARSREPPPVDRGQRADPAFRACSYRAQWNAHVCTNSFINLSVRSGGNEAVAPLDVVRDDAVSLTLSGTGNQPEHAAMSVIPGRGYTLQWGGAQPPTPRIYLNDAVVRETG